MRWDPSPISLGPSRRWSSMTVTLSVQWRWIRMAIFSCGVFIPICRITILKQYAADVFGWYNASHDHTHTLWRSGNVFSWNYSLKRCFRVARYRGYQASEFLPWSLGDVHKSYKSDIFRCMQYPGLAGQFVPCIGNFLFWFPVLTSFSSLELLVMIGGIVIETLILYCSLVWCHSRYLYSS